MAPPFNNDYAWDVLPETPVTANAPFYDVQFVDQPGEEKYTLFRLYNTPLVCTQDGATRGLEFGRLVHQILEWIPLDLPEPAEPARAMALALAAWLLLSGPSSLWSACWPCPSVRLLFLAALVCLACGRSFEVAGRRPRKLDERG